MHIHRVKILNFKGFASCEVELDPRFNLFVGDNATGKTSFLDALSIALDSYFLGMKGVERPGGIDSSQVRAQEHRYSDRISFEKQYPTRIEVEGTVLGRKVTWSRELSREGGRTNTAGTKKLSEISSHIDDLVRKQLNVDLPLVCSYGTERLWYEYKHNKSSRADSESRRWPSRFYGYRDCNVFVIQETALLEWIKAEVLTSQQLGKETPALSVTKKAIVACVDGAESIYYDARIDDIVVVSKEHGHQLFRFLSDGQRIMLTLIGDLVKRAVTLNPHHGLDVLDKTEGVVMVDELDLHLHPKWQRRVIHDLKRTFPSIQFIVTSHSPQLVGEALPNEIRILEKGQAHRVPRSFGMDSNRALEEVMDASSRNEKVKALLLELSSFVEAENLPNAKRVLEDVAAKLGDDDPEVTGANTLINLLEMSHEEHSKGS